MKFRRQIPRPTSLTTRLALWFALAAILTFTGVGTYLYHSLAARLEQRDDQELLGKIGLLRHIAQEAGSIAAIRADPHGFIDAVSGHDKMSVILRSKDATLILHDQEQQGEFPVLPATPLASMPQRPAIVQITDSAGQPARAVAAEARIKASGELLDITVARMTSDRMEILDNYRHEVWLAASCGTLLAALLGFFLVRHGLRPVRKIAALSQSITAHRLDTRIDVSTAPQELQEMVQAFNAMLDRLHDSFLRLSQFSADLAHDLRTPVNNLMVQTQVALSQLRSIDDYQNLLISNVEEYERLSRMVENMLFLARAEHAQIISHATALEARAELQCVADYFEGVADEAGIRISVQASGTIVADQLLLRRALGNLTANAVRYTAPGQRITLSASTSGNRTTVCVSNPGSGIDARHLERLFDRFYRVDTARANSSAAAGLGLAIVQSIMQLHRGSVGVSSEINGNTVFSLVFPSSQANQGEAS